MDKQETIYNMDESDFYEPIGKWLIDTQECVNNSYFLGFTTEPEIQWKEAGTTRPDVAGVNYEWTGNTNGSQEFHHHIVEVKAKVTPDSINTLIGQLHTDREYVMSGNVAADTAAFYAALPTMDIPQELEKHAQETGVGILGLETGTESEDYTIVREIHSPTRISSSRIDILSNNDQGSRGVFADAVANTAILSKIMTSPDQFFKSEIRKRQMDYNREKNRENFIQYIEENDSVRAAAALLEFFDNHDNLAVSPPDSGIKKGKFSLPVEWDSGRQALILTPQKRNFKIEDPDGKLYFRIAGKNKIEVTKDDAETLAEVEEWIEKHVV